MIIKWLKSKAKLVDVAHEALKDLHISEQEEAEMIEEVTEKIKEAAEADPYYRRLFGESDSEK